MRLLQSAFVSGEITKKLWGRAELPAYGKALAKCLNFIAEGYGSLTNRPGFEYTLEVKDSTKATRLIPFRFNAGQTYILELGNQYVRFHSQGGTLLETGKTITAITQANPGVFTSTAHGFSVGDWLYLSAIGGMTELNGRFFIVGTVPSADTFTLTGLAGVPVDTTSLTAYTSGGTASRVYEVTTPYLEADLFDIHYVQSADVLTLTHQNYAPRELKRLATTNWQLSTITFAPGISAPTGVAAATTPASPSGTPTTQTYVVTAISETLEESIASSSANCSNDLTVAGQYNTITWTTVTGAVRYNVYKDQNGIFGYIGSAPTGTFKDDNILPDLTYTPPQDRTLFAGAGDYPGTVSYFEQRRVFANSFNQPQTIWTTRSATESNITTSIPTRDDDAITFTLSAREVNEVRHLLPLRKLLVLTSGAEWVINSDTTGVLTPASVDPKPHGYTGSSNLMPIISGETIIYVQDRGSRVFDLAYQLASDGFSSRDVSILASHLVDGYTLTDWTYTNQPYRTAWAVRSDGALIGLTYMREHEVIAWHQHSTTGGYFESVAAVPEGNEDVLYAVIRRTVDGRSARYVERMHTRAISAVEDSFFVDAGLSYSGTATTTLSGLHHLEGETVALLADGNVLPQQVVTNGAITLPEACTKIHVGLPITADVVTLPVAVANAQAQAQGIKKSIAALNMRVLSSRGIFAGPDLNHLEEYKQRSTENYGQAVQLFTGEIRLGFAPDWSDDAQIYIRQTDPLPLTILSIVPETELGG